MGREHIENINAIDGATVVALADPDDASLAQSAALCSPGVATYDDHRNLLADDRVDAVVVASPNHTHADLLTDVLDAGPHVLVEKPLCTTVEDCQRVIEGRRRPAPGRPGRAGVPLQWPPSLASSRRWPAGRSAGSG